MKGPKIPECGGFPTGIIVSFGVKMMEVNGGREAFLKHFEHWINLDGNYWLHKCKNRPQFDIAHVYILEGGQVYGRVFYGGYETGARKIIKVTDVIAQIHWPRIRLAGPFERPPKPIPMRGFQGFRYVYEPLW